jgi:hypothetical protein
METMANTTHYPAILLRKRWREATPNERAGFEIRKELQRIHGEARLISSDISKLERWSAEIAQS